MVFTSSYEMYAFGQLNDLLFNSTERRQEWPSSSSSCERHVWNGCKKSQEQQIHSNDGFAVSLKVIQATEKKGWDRKKEKKNEKRWWESQKRIVMDEHPQTHFQVGCAVRIEANETRALETRICHEIGCRYAHSSAHSRLDHRATLNHPRISRAMLFVFAIAINQTRLIRHRNHHRKNARV